MVNYLKGHWQLIALTAVVVSVWHTPVVLPLKIIVVFLHELSHAFAAIMTGGTVLDLSLSARQGGHAVTQGGSPFIIFSAGYVGSLVLGVLLLVLALRTQADRLIVGICGAVTLAVTLFYIRDLFPLAFCILTGLCLLGAARFLPHQANDMILRVIGLTSLIYVPYDIFDDTIARSNLRSDAFMLAERYGGTTMFWGGLWLVISLAVILWCLRYGIGRDSNIRFGSGAA